MICTANMKGIEGQGSRGGGCAANLHSCRAAGCFRPARRPSTQELRTCSRGNIPARAGVIVNANAARSTSSDVDAPAFMTWVPATFSTTLHCICCNMQSNILCHLPESRYMGRCTISTRNDTSKMRRVCCGPTRYLHRMAIRTQPTNTDKHLR
jgi:hypothetical protein